MTNCYADDIFKMHVSTEANFVSKIYHNIVYEDINLKKVA